MRYISPWGAVLMAVVVPSASAQAPNRSELEQKIVELRAQLDQLEHQFLEPAPADSDAFPGYRGKPDRGLLRLLPRERYDEPEAMTVRGGGDYYSFTPREHAYGYGSDIQLANGTLSVGFAGADYGFLVAVPTATIDTIR